MEFEVGEIFCHQHQSLINFCVGQKWGKNASVFLCFESWCEKLFRRCKFCFGKKIDIGEISQVYHKQDLSQFLAILLRYEKTHHQALEWIIYENDYWTLRTIIDDELVPKNIAEELSEYSKDLEWYWNYSVEYHSW